MIKYHLMKDFLRLLSTTIATVFFIGYIPFAPGTFGSLAGLIFIFLLRPDFLWQTVIIISGFIIGTLSAHSAETSLGEKDSKHIVIDEFVGYLIAIAFIPLTTGYLIAAFCLFRFFDILKPPPIRNLEKTLHGGIGIMMDDVLAGIFSNIILQTWRVI